MCIITGGLNPTLTIAMETLQDTLPWTSAKKKSPNPHREAEKTDYPSYQPSPSKATKKNPQNQKQNTKNTNNNRKRRKREPASTIMSNIRNILCQDLSSSPKEREPFLEVDGRMCQTHIRKGVSRIPIHFSKGKMLPRGLAAGALSKQLLGRP